MVYFDNAADAESSACSSASLNGDITAKRVKEARKKRKSHHRDSTTATTTDAATAEAADGSLPTKRRHSVSKPARDRRDQPEKKSKKKRKIASAIAEETGAGTETRSPSPVVDFDGLSRPSKGTRERLEESPEKAEARLERMAGAVRTLLECVGEDPDREGILATPERYAKAMLFFTKGYQQNVADIVNGAIFHEGHNEMVIVKDIDIFSMCEHHLVPFTGKMHIGYIPKNSVIGLSKLPRIAEMFARRLQVQERLTKEVANAIMEVLKPQGVAVVMESSHLCMVMRGVEKTSATTITSCVLGCFERKEKTRNEFLSLVGVNRR
ncbi:hypothetical protein GE09DRAFT_1146726 [Coniochaeta sp. 2T2.1]|nr:hypothetical protein GE09DRAFT_1146726 [Coniochaeta sp. 2T2.1]